MLHTGQILSGTMTNTGDALLAERPTTYLAEKAATDDVLAQLPGDSRVVMWFDSTSHAHALLRFSRSVARRRKQFHAAGRHSATLKLLRAQQVVVYHWQRSHTGEPQNEAADVAAAAAAEREEFSPLVESVHDYCSLLFVRDVHSPRSWAVARADVLVAERLRACSVHTIYESSRDICAHRQADPEDALLPLLRAERCFYSDAGLKLNDRQTKHRELATCPWGCARPCTWVHFAFECVGCEIVDARRSWDERLMELQQLCEIGGLTHAQLEQVRRWTGSALGRQHAGIPGGAVDDWPRDKLREARRALCGMFDRPATGDIGKNTERREAVSSARSASLALMRVAQVACRLEWAEKLRQQDMLDRVARKYVRALRERIFQGGPARMRALRELDSLKSRAEAIGGEGVEAASTAIKAKRAEAHACTEWPGGRRPWWILARLLRWRLRAWRRTTPRFDTDGGTWKTERRLRAVYERGPAERWCDELILAGGASWSGVLWGSSGGRGARATRRQGCVCLQAGRWCPRSAAASQSRRRRHRQAPSSRRPPQPVASLGRARRTRRGRDFYRLERARRLRQWSREAGHCSTCGRTARPSHRHRSTSGRERGVGRCAGTRRATTPGGRRRCHRRQVTVGQPLRGQTMERFVASRERREHARQSWRAPTTGGLGNVAPQAPTRGASRHRRRGFSHHCRPSICSAQRLDARGEATIRAR